MMKRILVIAAALLTTAGCAATRSADGKDSPYANPFYAKYLNTGSTLDAQISRTLEGLRSNPRSPELHNTLGTLLVAKGFPKDAEREFERAVNANRKYYPAWYNLGLVRAAHGDELGARRALQRTVDLKPGHAAALFQLGLVEENRSHTERAVALYAKAFSINPALLEVSTNPRILDTKLTHLALLRMYPNQHSNLTMDFYGSPMPRTSQPQEAPSPQAAPTSIVPPAAPATDPAMQSAPRPASKAAPPVSVSAPGPTAPATTQAAPAVAPPPERRKPPVKRPAQPSDEEPVLGGNPATPTKPPV